MTATATPARRTAPARASRGLWRDALARLTRNGPALLGMFFIVVFVLAAVLAPVISPYDPIAGSLANRLQAPGTAGHVLGTDLQGRDELTRILYGARISLQVGVISVIMGLAIGGTLGAIAGAFGGAVDNVLMRIVDVLLAIPALFIFIYLATVIRPTIGILIGILSLIGWLGPARLVRGETLSLRTREYVQAVRVMGGRSWRVVLRHIVPNTIGTIVVNATFQIADAILVLATLSFLGFGLPPPAVNWGGMLSNGVSYSADGYWWLIYPAGIMIILTVIAFNFIGDALRDALEVRLQQR